MEKTEIEKMIRGHLQIGTSHPDNKNVLELSEALVKSLQSAYQAKDTLRDAFYAGQLYQRSIDKNTKQHAPNFEAYYNSLSSPPAEKELKTEWISVEERHPAYIEPVLTIDKNNNVRILQREDWESGNDVEGFKSGEFWTDPETSEEYEIELITHWTPLPNPPKTI